jgi:hypothetical protein
MSSRIRFLLPLAAFCLAPSAHATDLAYVKCAVNQDRVWVYESLGSFDVETRLRCGAPVEILSRVKGFVKIRTESGVEGFVADGAFPDLPPLADDSDKPAAAAAQSLAAAAAQRQQAAKPAPVSVAANAPVPSPAMTPEPAKAAPISAAAVISVPTPAPAPAAEPRPAVVATAAPVAPAPMPVKATTPAKHAASAPASSAPAPAAKISTASAKTKSTPAATAKKSDRAFDSAPAAPLVHSAPAAPATPATASAKPSVETVSDSMRETATYVPATAMTDTKELEDSEDYPDTKPQNDSADPACRLFFAAYGIAPSQYKWFAEDRRKEYSQICPAPDVAHVDYVVLFTHDSDSYNYALPVPVHTDHNGFSDFSALTTVDTALMTASEVQKARYEFVWVFRVKRGEFDPARFSARRKPQFTTYVKGSRASARAIEDAFNFVQTQGDH